MGGPLSFLYAFYKAFCMFCPKSQAEETLFWPHFWFLLGVPLGVILGTLSATALPGRHFFSTF